MARPIQNTPVITGEDAKRFRKELLEMIVRKSSAADKKAKEQEMKRMKKNYDLLVSISDGAFY